MVLAKTGGGARAHNRLAMVSARAARGGSREDWRRRYPPLVLAVVSLLLAVFALPSALTLPLSNPGQTLEYAPVPGNNPGPVQGNLAALGLGSSATGPGGAGGVESGLAGALGLPQNTGANPSNKHCVGSPPRQTEDPLSPPCVAFFNGDNGGSTYTGVSGKEVVVLYYLDGNQTDYTTSSGAQPVPTSKYVDMAAPVNSSDGIWSVVLHAVMVDFNTRYQTYNRRVHIWAYFNSGTANASPQQRRSDAADNWQTLHPFAVISYPQFDSQDYLSAMAEHGVLALVGSKMENTGSIGAPASYFPTYAGHLWSFDPSIDYRAREFADLICAEVANRQVAFSGNVVDSKKTRKLGILIPHYPNYPEQAELAQDVRSDLAGCVPDLIVGSKYDDTGGGGDASFVANATQQMATFKRDGVTTVIDPGQGAYDTRGAAAVSYYPEWIVAGDGLADATINGSLQDQSVFKNAWLMTTWTHRGPDPNEDPCVQSAIEANPQFAMSDVLEFYCPVYDSSRQLFTGIQVAGPKLTPGQVDAGFHAIPHVASSSNRVPSCFYASNDYTCVKDAMLEWWDPSGTDPEYGALSGNSGSGCWRIVEDGARHIDSWPSREISSVKTGSDQCNGQY